MKSEPWPSRSAVLEYCAIWTSRAPLASEAERIADGRVVVGITSSLDPQSAVTGAPHRLAANERIAFQGSNVVGIGFTLEPDQARQLIEKDPRNSKVLYPFLNGQDLNTRPDCSASRWIVNFHDWPIDEAKRYPDAFAVVVKNVKPQRDLLPDYKKRVREAWWKYEHQARPLYAAIHDLDRVIVITRVSKSVMPAMVPTGQVMSDATVVFASDDPGMLTLLSSAQHYWWAISRSSSMRTDLRYTPSDVFLRHSLCHSWRLRCGLLVVGLTDTDGN